MPVAASLCRGSAQTRRHSAVATRHLRLYSLTQIFVVMIIGIAIVAVAPAMASDWTVIHQHGRDYVTFSNVARFYQFPGINQVDRTVSLHSSGREIRAQIGSSELFINGVRFFTDFPILSNGQDALVSAMDVKKIIEPILRPHQIKNVQKITTVVLDPGHGGADQGSTNGWGTEKSFALNVALMAREHLQSEGFKVEMTRDQDSDVSLEDRVRFANQFSNAVFISIHFNSSNSSADGVESYALAPAGVPSNAASKDESFAADTAWQPGNAQDPENMAIATAVHAAILSRVSVVDRGLHHARFHVLRNIKIPGVLIEGGFMSNPQEAQRIASPEYRREIGLAIAQAVRSYNAAVDFRSGATREVAAHNDPLHSGPAMSLSPSNSPRKPDVAVKPPIEGQ